MTQPHHLAEAGILIRELKSRGFDCMALGENLIFQEAMRQYAEVRMSFDGLVEIANKLAILNPGLKESRDGSTLEN